MKARLWFYGTILAALVGYVMYATSMPRSSHRGPLPPSGPEVKELEARLREHVRVLAGSIGERNTGRPGSLEAARDYIVGTLRSFAGDKANVRLEDVGPSGHHAQNVVLDLPGQGAGPIVVVGAHYDSAPGSPGANDNGSGVAAALELARSVAELPARSPIRFAFFVNEEPPFFQNPGMGSLVHAEAARERGDAISAMLSLETVGYYSDEPGSQRYPWPLGLLYPERGDFVAFVGNLRSRGLVRRAIRAFRRSVAFPSEGGAFPAFFPGVDWSDHWAFWHSGYPAIMVTDTALYRDPHYHQPTDAPEHLSYERLARVVVGLEGVVRELSRRGR